MSWNNPRKNMNIEALSTMAFARGAALDKAQAAALKPYSRAFKEAVAQVKRSDAFIAQFDPLAAEASRKHGLGLMTMYRRRTGWRSTREA